MNGLGLPCFPNLDNNKVWGGLQALDLQILCDSHPDLEALVLLDALSFKIIHRASTWEWKGFRSSEDIELGNASQCIDLIMKSKGLEALVALSSEMLPRASIWEWKLVVWKLWRPSVRFGKRGSPEPFKKLWLFDFSHVKITQTIQKTMTFWLFSCLNHRNRSENYDFVTFPCLWYSWSHGRDCIRRGSQEYQKHVKVKKS